MSQSIIRKILESKLSAWASGQSLLVAWENHHFDAPMSAYLRAFILPIPTRSIDMSGAHRGFSGIFQVSVVCAAGDGPSTAESIIDLLDTEFQVNTPMTDSGLTALIVRPMSAGPPIKTDRYTVPASCTYRAETI